MMKRFLPLIFIVFLFVCIYPIQRFLYAHLSENKDQHAIHMPSLSQDHTDKPIEANLGKPYVIIIGDSLSSGYGVPKDQSWPVTLRQALIQHPGCTFQFINQSVAGHTTAFGLAQLKQAMTSISAQDVSLLILSLGGNDMLQGKKPVLVRQSLTRIIDYANKLGLNHILLLKSSIPVNFGEVYIKAWRDMYRSLEQTYPKLIIVNWLDGLLSDRILVQGDGIHPNKQGQSILAKRVMPYVQQAIVGCKVRAS